VLSWFVRNPYGALYKLQAVLIQLTEPMLMPCRRLLERLGLRGGIDFSPLLAILALGFISRVIIRILILIMYY